MLSSDTLASKRVVFGGKAAALSTIHSGQPLTHILFDLILDVIRRKLAFVAPVRPRFVGNFSEAYASDFSAFGGRKRQPPTEATAFAP